MSENSCTSTWCTFIKLLFFQNNFVTSVPIFKTFGFQYILFSVRKVRTLYACRGENEMELSFEPNEVIYNGKVYVCIYLCILFGIFSNFIASPLFMLHCFIH